MEAEINICKPKEFKLDQKIRVYDWLGKPEHILIAFLMMKFQRLEPWSKPFTQLSSKEKLDISAHFAKTSQTLSMNRELIISSYERSSRTK